MNDTVRAYGANAYSYNQTHDAREALSRLADMGFRDVELILYPGHIWPSDIDEAGRRELKRFLDAHDLRLMTLGTPILDWNPTGIAAETRAYTLAMLKAAIVLAGDLGAGGIIMGPGKAHAIQPAPPKRLRGWLFAALDELLPLAERYGTEVLLENLAVAFVPDADGLMEVLDAYGDDRVGIVYDVANALGIGEDPLQGLARVAPRLRRVHVSDTTRHAFRHDPIGAGDIDFAALGPAIQEAGCRLPPILEIISGDPDSDIPKSAQALSDCNWDRLFGN